MSAAILEAKGGMMFFTVERADLVYMGAVLLSRVNNGQRTRIVAMKVYRHRQETPGLIR